MLRFVLSRPAVVEFIVLRVAPDCVQVGRFRVAGRAGVNRVPFRGRLRGRFLPPGAYRIRARTLPGGRALAETRLVIFRRTPDRAELAAARASNSCRAETAEAGMSPAVGSAAPRSAGRGEAQAQGAAAEGTDRRRGRDYPAGVLGAQFSRAADVVTEIHPMLYVLLGMAIALLGLAAVPVHYVPNARIAALLAYSRGTVAAAGAAALLAVSVIYVLA